MIIKNGKEKTVMCANCKKELSGSDLVVVDDEGVPYCSKKCLLTFLYWKTTTAQKYIKEKSNGKNSMEN